MSNEVMKNKDYWIGFKAACELVGDMYNSVCNHPLHIGDCALSKMNKLSKNKIRKNNFYKKFEP